MAAETKEVKTAQEEAPAKAKPPAKAQAKPLPQLMEEDVIPSLKTILEAQPDLSEIELSFQDNRVRFFFLLLKSYKLTCTNRKKIIRTLIYYVVKVRSITFSFSIFLTIFVKNSLGLIPVFIMFLGFD